MEDNKIIAPMSRIHMVPMDVIDGFEVSPGMYEINGATGKKSLMPYCPFLKIIKSVKCIP